MFGFWCHIFPGCMLGVVAKCVIQTIGFPKFEDDLKIRVFQEVRPHSVTTGVNILQKEQAFVLGIFGLPWGRIFGFK